MTLGEQVKIFKKSLGLEGKMRAVLDQAADLLGVTANYKSLPDLSAACMAALDRRRAAALPPSDFASPPRASASPRRAAAPTPPRAAVPPPLLPAAPPSSAAAPGPPSVESSPPAAASPRRPAPPAPPEPNLSGHCVRIDGLKARPELNGRCGVARHYDAVKGRYEVAVEGEVEVVVLLKPANLQDAGKASIDPPSLDGLSGSHLHALPPPLAAVWEVKLSGAFQPYKSDEEQRALEQAWGRGESQVQLERGHVVHLTGPMRQVAQHGKGREVRRRVLSEFAG